MVKVYKLSIGAACRLSYPADRVIIQVLDDSTDPEIKVIGFLLFVFVGMFWELIRVGKFV